MRAPSNPRIPFSALALTLVVLLAVAGCGNGTGGSSGEGAAGGEGTGTRADGGGFVDPRFESEDEHERTSNPVPMHAPEGDALHIVLEDASLQAPSSMHSGHTTFVVHNTTLAPLELTTSGAGLAPSSRTIPSKETFEFDLVLQPGTLRLDAGERRTFEVIVD